jgi:type I restriction enzyme S subunit
VAVPHTVRSQPGLESVFSDGDWIETKDQDPAGDVRLIQLADIGDGKFRDRSNRFLTSAKAAELGCTYLQRGDVLIARMPDPLGRACVFPGDEKPSVTAVDVCIVRPGPDAVNPTWLMWAVNAPQFRVAVAALQSGTTRKRISRSNLATIPLPVPPLPEQARMVAVIEEQFSRIDAGVESLERARRNLKRMRAAVLQAAVAGRLVDAHDRAATTQLLAELLGDSADEAIVEDGALPELPDGSVWVRLGALISEPLRNGHCGSSQAISSSSALTPPNLSGRPLCTKVPGGARL